ncbi:aspartyl-tRNA(Asn)/glutamyl-tRNA(Gln) amidotransferase subunit A [Gemmobacter aquatilis]|uniref:Aspartyl-tRNA(Asn)/glutamyl-tRNA(Gln) amidotransferase subunit A n=1 Tax=Gemmobacter aquatilis TaxID=933059 RepID=A0A1H8JJN8_9RHOB|nr:amidase family protein [Gemmobacter aquatilis]SEN80970.1 aspartyl-tRNA(Asn)/glutamyl-tRNA(Gln) amidotransferase subunit A [Gemmobacter aquatilis]
MDKWLGRTAADLGRAIGAGKLHPVDLTEAYLEAIASHPDAPRIYARTTPRRAQSMAMAAAQRARSGTRIGLLDGVPLSWKDNFDAAGAVCEAGSALLKGRVPAVDAEVLHSATAQGLICLGKTHMTELAFSGLGLNPVTATPPCVNFPGAVPGGSSSGAAASVAFGLAPAAIGTDTGGSVRIPAAWNDLVGLKTTPGRLSLKGVVPLCERFDTVGPLAHTVEDCALLLAVLEGGAPADLAGVSLAGTRIAVLDSVAMDDLREAPAKGFEDALAGMAKAGAGIAHIRLPEVEEAMRIAGVVFTPEAYAIWGETIEAAPHKMYAPVLERFRSGATVKATDYVAGWRRLEVLRGIWGKLTAGYDAVAIPTSAILPPEAQRLLDDPAYFAAENLLALRNTRIGNLFGLCVLTLPTGQPSCGISLMAEPGKEERLLRLGAAVERALG